MGYPSMPNYNQIADTLRCYAQLKHEYGSKGIEPILVKVEKEMQAAVARLKKLPIDAALAKKEPNTYKDILALRPRANHRLWESFDAKAYEERIAGAFIGRCIGNVLGAPVEFYDIGRMERIALENKQAFPPTQHWKRVPDMLEKRYQTTPRSAYTLEGMDSVGTDDDLIYTQIGLLIAEEYGLDFTTDDVGKAWIKYLPFACTAEDIALKNLKKGVPAKKAADIDNPYCEWIGADIRSDPWGYMAPGLPEKAARMAYVDAYLSHRRQGIYGEMYFSAAIAAAFAVDDPIEALKLGLNEIPRDCAMAREVRWALSVAPKIKNYKEARAAMEKRYECADFSNSFKGMHPVHTINNAALTIWGITIGKKDFSKVIGETVAMGMDNDCTAATAGSIVGAVVGKKGIPAHWYNKFNNTVHTYLIGEKSFKIDDILRRFATMAKQAF